MHFVYFVVKIFSTCAIPPSLVIAVLNLIQCRNDEAGAIAQVEFFYTSNCADMLQCVGNRFFQIGQNITAIIDYDICIGH